MSGANESAVMTTRRQVVAHVALCKGCCCGNTDRGKPPVPVERIKSQWKQRGLTKVVQLTISGCLGPCDVLNVARVSGEGEDVWVGGLTTEADYDRLVDWAEQCKLSSRFVELPMGLQSRRIEPFVKDQ